MDDPGMQATWSCFGRPLTSSYLGFQASWSYLRHAGATGNSGAQATRARSTRIYLGQPLTHEYRVGEADYSLSFKVPQIVIALKWVLVCFR